MVTPRRIPGTSETFKSMFQMPVYQYCQKNCWKIDSFKWQTAMMVELLKLQQENQIPSSVTTEAMMDLLVKKSNMTLAVQKWHSVVESCRDPAFVPLLNMMWDVNINLRRSDIEFKARVLLNSTEDNIPDEFKHRMAFRVAEKYAAILTEQQQPHFTPRLMTLQEMVPQVVTRVVQSFWLPPLTTCVSMPSQHINVVAVCMTKVVEDEVVQSVPSHLPYVFLSRTKRDKLVQTVVADLMRQGHAPRTLRRQSDGLDAKLLKAMADEVTKQICHLFLPHHPTQVSVQRSPGRGPH